MIDCMVLMRNSNIKTSSITDTTRRLLDEGYLFISGEKVMISAKGMSFMIEKCPEFIKLKRTRSGIYFMMNGLVKLTLSNHTPKIFDVLYSFKKKDEDYIEVRDFSFRSVLIDTYKPERKIKMYNILSQLSSTGFFKYTGSQIIVSSEQVKYIKTFLDYFVGNDDFKDEVKLYKPQNSEEDNNSKS